MSTPSEEVVLRLLLAKSLLDRTRMHPVADADDFFVAQQVLTAHDAADLAISAIANHCGAVQTKNFNNALMDNIGATTALAQQAGKTLTGTQYMGQLNNARNALKHAGILPNKQQFARTTDKTYEIVTEWCRDIAGIDFPELDHADLLHLTEVRQRYKFAQAQARMGLHEQALITISKALHILFRESAALRGFKAGVARPEDAIKLTGFGVHGNDYLAMQEFLPTISEPSKETEDLKHHWKQTGFGHPANWREDTVSFCLRVFLSIAIKIQSAEWIPGPIDFRWVYEYKVTALETTDIWKERPAKDESPEVLRSLEKGGFILVEDVKVLPAHDGGGNLRTTLRTLLFIQHGFTGSPEKDYERHLELDLGEGWRWDVGFVRADHVQVTCTPKQDKFTSENFPSLPEIEWKQKFGK